MKKILVVITVLFLSSKFCVAQTTIENVHPQSRHVHDGRDDIGDRGVDIYTGHGRINFGKTIELVKIWEFR